jgi:hypothetical protein
MNKKQKTCKKYIYDMSPGGKITRREITNEEYEKLTFEDDHKLFIQEIRSGSDVLFKKS